MLALSNLKGMSNKNIYDVQDTFSKSIMLAHYAKKVMKVQYQFTSSLKKS